MTDLPNIVLIVLDTMRKDTLRAYGGGAETPALDLIARDGVAYQNCIAPSPWTLPSHASLFSGQPVSRHGVHESREAKIPHLFNLMAKNEVGTFVEKLQERGYNNVGFSANANIAPSSGFDTAFNSFTFVDPNQPTTKERKFLQRTLELGSTKGEVATSLLKQGRPIELFNLYMTRREIQHERARRQYPIVKGGDRISEMITSSSFEEPFLVFANLFEMHEPYTDSEPTSMMDLFGKRKVGDRLLEQMKHRYQFGAKTVDNFVGSIVRYLKECGAYDESLVIITSDHGQAFKEHGFFGHGTFLYPEIVEVPLVVKFPGNKRPARREGYQTLTRIPELIMDCLIGMSDGDSLTRESAISESFGISNNVSTVSDAEAFATKLEKLNRPSKLVCFRGYRLVVDGAKGEIKEFTRNGAAISVNESRDIVGAMMEPLQELGDSAFKFPEKL